MPTHHLTIELSTGAHKVLQKLISSGEFQTENEALEQAVFELEFAVSQGTGSEKLAAWQEDEFRAAYDEDKAHPERAISAEELHDALTSERRGDTDFSKQASSHLPQWFLDDAVAAAEELDAHPELGLSQEQVDEYLAQQRQLRKQAVDALPA